MSHYKFLKAVIQDEELQDSIRKFKADYNVNDEDEVIRIALLELFSEEGYI